MPTPTIILQKPYLLVQSGSSIAGGVNNSSGTNFGQVILAYATCDICAAGNNIMYLTEGQIDVWYSATQYVIIKDDKVLNVESEAP